MGKTGIGFDKWPFSKGEQVKLIKISKPYSSDGLWYIDAVYLSKISKRAKRVKHYFGDLHLLICGGDYLDGKRQDMPGWTTMDIHVSKKAILNRKPEPYLNKDKINQSEFNYYTFGISNDGSYVIIPLHELLRTTLAPDIFWLNQVTLLDSIETRVIYESDSYFLKMTFLSDVPVKYVKMDEKIKHAAWVFSNPNIYEMINQTYQSIRNGEGIKFDFLFEELSFRARVEIKDNKTYIKEIVSFKRKKINCRNIFVYHPSLLEYEPGSDEKEKKWTPVTKSDGDRSLVSDKTAAPGKLDINRYETVESEYSSFVKIKRIRSNRSSGKRISLKTIPKCIDGKSKRTTSDFGGLETVPQLEFENNVGEKFEGLFTEIISVLSLMENRDEVTSIEYHIGELNHHYRFRSICTLADEITPRRYLVGKIQLIEGQEAILIEVERENLALTTLMLISNTPQNWKLICHQIMKGLIKKSGSWPAIENFGFKQLESHRFKHTNADVSQREKRMFKSLYVG